MDMEMEFGDRVNLATERIKLWADVLVRLSEGDLVAKLVTVLDEGDMKGFEELLAPDRVLQVGGCIDVVSTITKVINFGLGHYENRCELAPPLLLTIFNSDQVSSYALPDGQIVPISN